MRERDLAPERASATPRLARRAGRVLLGLFLGLVLCELALRVASAVALARLDDRAVWVEPGPGGLAIACAGDSNTYGVYELPGDAYPARLEQLLNERVGAGPHRVQNLGAPGANTGQIAEVVEDALARHRVDAVLLLTGNNDGWTWTGAADARPPWYERLRLAKLARVALQRVSTGRANRGQQVERGAFEAAVRSGLARIAARCRDAGVPLVLLTYGSGENDYGLANRFTRAAASELGLPLADGNARIAAARAELGFDCLLHPDGHPNLLGYELVAREVYATLVSAGIAAGAPIEEPLRGLATLGDDPAQVRAYGSLAEARSGSADFGVEVADAAGMSSFVVMLTVLRDPEPGTDAPLLVLRGEVGPDGSARKSLREHVLARAGAEPATLRVRAMAALLGGAPQRVRRFTRPADLVLQ